MHSCPNWLALPEKALYRPAPNEPEGQSGTMAPRTPKDAEKKPARSAKPGKKKPVAEAAPKPAPTLVESPETAEKVAAMKLKDLIEGVAAATGGKKPEVKAVVAATLAAMGEALAAGKALALPPLGKLRVVKAKGPSLTLKLRRAEAASAAALALADDGEDS